MINVFALIGFISVALYLVDFFLFASDFKNRNPELWRSLEFPDILGIRGQVVYLSIVLGIQKLPESTIAMCRTRLVRIRAFLGMGVIAFVALAILTG